MEYQMNSSSCFNNDGAYTCEWWKKMIKINDEEEELLTNGMRKGPWTEEEDTKLTSAIAMHGAGRWNTLANLAGLKRSGKSCRLRWLNYLHPDLRRGPFTLTEQLLIIQLQLHWGNRWSKIAESLSGRTDNEVKNYWRTKVQKLARQFNCNVNSAEFRDALHQIWIPRLIEQINAGANSSSNTAKNQSDGPDYQYGLGQMGSSGSSTSSEACCLLDTHTSWAQNSLAQQIVGSVDLCSNSSSNTGISPLANAPKAQIDGPDYLYGLGLMGSSSSISSSSTSSETYCFDTYSCWAQNSLDQHVVGPIDMCSKPSTFTDSCTAHISVESGSPVELDPSWAQKNNYWGMTPNDGDDMLFLEQQPNYLA